jgi:hypothetical protein
MSKRQFLHIIAYSACLLFFVLNHVSAEDNFPRFQNLKKTVLPSGTVLSGEVSNKTQYMVEPWFEIYQGGNPNNIYTLKTGVTLKNGKYTCDVNNVNLNNVKINPVLSVPNLLVQQDSRGQYYCYRGAVVRVSKAVGTGEIVGYYIEDDFPAAFVTKYPDVADFHSNSAGVMDTIDLVYSAGFGPFYGCGYIAQPLWFCEIIDGQANTVLTAQTFARRGACHYYLSDNYSGNAMQGCFLSQDDCLSLFDSGDYELAKKREGKKYYFIGLDKNDQRIAIKTANDYQDRQECEINIVRYAKENIAKYKLKQIYGRCYDEEPDLNAEQKFCRDNIKISIVGQTNFTQDEAKTAYMVIDSQYNCANSYIEFRQDSCTGKLLSSCTTGFLPDIKTGGYGCHFRLTGFGNSVGRHAIAACADKNGDSQFTRFGEMSTVYYEILPQSDFVYFDWRNRPKGSYVTPAKDQDGSGTCSNFREVGAMESRYLIERDLPNQQIDLSESFLAACDVENQQYGNGNIVDSQIPMRTVDENCFPYDSRIVDAGGNKTQYANCNNRCASWQSRMFVGWSKFIVDRRQATISEVQKNIRLNGPLYGYILATNPYFDETGKMRCRTPLDPKTAHGVLIIGYSQLDGSWIIKNSWGTNWGDNGFARIPYGECNIFPNPNEDVIIFSKVNEPGEIIKP